MKYHNPVPHFAGTVRNSQIQKLVKLYDANGLHLPVIETIRSNNCEPIQTKGQSCSSDLNDLLFERVHATRFDVNYTLNETENMFFNCQIKCDLKKSLVIEKQTRMQSKNAKWFAEREYRIYSLCIWNIL